MSPTTGEVLRPKPSGLSPSVGKSSDVTFQHRERDVTTSKMKKKSKSFPLEQVLALEDLQILQTVNFVQCRSQYHTDALKFPLFMTGCYIHFTLIYLITSSQKSGDVRAWWIVQCMSQTARNLSQQGWLNQTAIDAVVLKNDGHIGFFGVAGEDVSHHLLALKLTVEFPKPPLGTFTYAS